MGFGILLIGYMLSFGLYPACTDFIAYTVIFISLLQLGEYNAFFKISKILSFAVTVLGMAGLMLVAGEFIGFVDESNRLIDIYDHASELLKIVFHVPLLLGICKISSDTELPKYSSTAIWCIVLDILYAVVYGLCFAEARLLPYRTVMRGILMLVVLVLIFNCFRMICKEGDEKTPWYTIRTSRTKNSDNGMTDKGDRE